jgi:hypothetical protein
MGQRGILETGRLRCARLSSRVSFVHEQAGEGGRAREGFSSRSGVRGAMRLPTQRLLRSKPPARGGHAAWSPTDGTPPAQRAGGAVAGGAAASCAAHPRQLAASLGDGHGEAEGASPLSLPLSRPSAPEQEFACF